MAAEQRGLVWGKLGNIRLPLQVDIGVCDVINPPPPQSAYPILMRDSGVEWPGEIPAHWGIRPTESFASYDKQAVDPATLNTADKVSHYSIPSIQETGDGTVEPPSQIGSTKSLITGSLLLVPRLNPRKGVVVLATEKSIPTLCSTEFVPLRMNERHDERWAFYEFLSEPIRQRLSGMVQSATRSHQRVDVGHILKVIIPFPLTPSNAPSPASSTIRPPESTRSSPRPGQPSNVCANIAAPWSRQRSPDRST